VDNPPLTIKSSNNSVARKRGAPKGNGNAFKHGVRTAEWRAFNANLRALITSAKTAIRRKEIFDRFQFACRSLARHREAYEVHVLIADTAGVIGSGTNFAACRAALKPSTPRPNS
jgi:hypothetical protein